MKTEYFALDTHGNHNRWDDGKDKIGDMVEAAAKKGIIPAMTLHNNLKVRSAFREYLEAMNSCSLSHVALPGIEWEFSVFSSDISAAASVRPDIAIGIMPGASSVERHGNKLKMEVQFITSDHIEEEQKRLVSLFNGIETSSPMDFDKVFAAFYLRLFYQFGDRGKDAREILSINPQIEMDFVEEIYRIHKHKQKRLKNQGEFKRQKGELLCLMPPDKKIMDRMSYLVKCWVEDGWPKKGSLQLLQDYLQAGLRPEHYDRLLFILPHFASLDASSRWGQVITRLTEGDISLYAPEIFVPDVAKRVHGVEVLNGAVPNTANYISVKAAGTELLKNKARTGGGDAHCVEGVGSAVTLGKARRLDSDGIIEAVKNGETLPVSGWGKLSNTVAPFIFWALTVPIQGKTFSPKVVYKLMEHLIDIETPIKEVIDKDLVSSRQSIREWYY